MRLSALGNRHQMRPRRALLGALLGAALVAAAAYGAEPQAVVTLRAEAMVGTVEVLLGQVCDIAAPPELTARLSDISLSSAPLPDRTRTIEAGYLKLRLRRFGIDPAQVDVRGEKVTVRRSPSPAAAGPAVAATTEAAPVVLPRLVRQGQLVEVEVCCGGVVIRTAAVACRDGALGDLIDLRVGPASRRLLARVTGPGRGLAAITERTP